MTEKPGDIREDSIVTTVKRLAEFDQTTWEFGMIPVEMIVPGRYQPRRTFDEVSLKELSESMVSSGGNTQAITVRKVGESTYELIAGERRWRAAQIAQIPSLAAMICTVTDKQAMVMAMVENVQREDLNIIEAAEGYKRMIDEAEMTHADIAAATGKSRAVITNLIRLLSTDIRVRDLLRSGRLSPGAGKIIAGLKDLGQQREIASTAVKKGWDVRSVEREVAKLKDRPHKEVRSKARDIVRLEEEVSERSGFPCTIDVSTSGKVSLSFRFADNHGLDAFLKQQKFVVDD